MSTRSRRSQGANADAPPPLNPAMIQLLPLAKLREALAARGFDTKGNKQTLADRLEEALTISKESVLLGEKKKSDQNNSEEERQTIKPTPAAEKASSSTNADALESASGKQSVLLGENHKLKQGKIEERQTIKPTPAAEKASSSTKADAMDSADGKQSVLLGEKNKLKQGKVEERKSIKPTPAAEKASSSTKADAMDSADGKQSVLLGEKNKLKQGKVEERQIVKPAPIAKKASSSTSVDLLDSIIGGQTVLLCDKYKSEQEKSEERQNLELEKRRKSVHAFHLPPMEKRPRDAPRPMPSIDFDSSISPPVNNVPSPSLSPPAEGASDKYQLTCVEKLRRIFPQPVQISPLPQPAKQPSTLDVLNMPPPPPPSIPPPSTAKRIIMEPPAKKSKLVVDDLPPPPPPSVPPPPTAKKVALSSNVDAMVSVAEDRSALPCEPKQEKAEERQNLEMEKQGQSGQAFYLRDAPRPMPNIDFESSISPPMNNVPSRIFPPPAQIPPLPHPAKQTLHPDVLNIPPPPPSMPPPRTAKRIDMEPPTKKSKFVVDDLPPPPPPSVPPPPTAKKVASSSNVDAMVSVVGDQSDLLCEPKQEKAEERQNFELEKQEQSGQAFNLPPMERLPLETLPSIPNIDIDSSISPSMNIVPSPSDAPRHMPSINFDSSISPLMNNVPSPSSSPPAEEVADKFPLTCVEELQRISPQPSQIPPLPQPAEQILNIDVDMPPPLNPSSPTAEGIDMEPPAKKSKCVDDDLPPPSAVPPTPTAKKVENRRSSALLQKANAILQDMENSEVRIYQEEFVGDFETIEEEKPPVEFHGEPVPDEEDDDDALFEMAAGLPKKKKEPKPIEEEPLPDEDFVELDYYNADFNIKANPQNKWLIDPDNGDGFALMFGGVRSNYGIIAPEIGENFPRIAFQIEIVEFMSLKHVPFEEIEPHSVRIGWSIQSAPTLLGESAKSYAFCSLGRKINNEGIREFGDSFQKDDIITTVLDFEKQEICYYKNDVFLGVAFSNNLFSPGDLVFPHISIKNCKVLVNFGLECPESDKADKWKIPDAEADTVFVAKLNKRNLKPSNRPPIDKSECTVIMMVGLPGVGKSTWVKQYLRDHPNEKWIYLNVESFLNGMKVNGMPRKRVQHGRWDMIMGLASKALSRTFALACRRRHNYIIDQSNCNRDARKRKLTLFEGFHRKCVVICPNDQVAEERRLKRNDIAGEIPIEAMLEMKATMSLPNPELEPVEDVTYIEPTVERISEAIELIERYNQEGQPWIRKHKKNRSFISDNRGHSNKWIGSESRQQNSNGMNNSVGGGGRIHHVSSSQRNYSSSQNSITNEHPNAENFLHISLGPTILSHVSASPSPITPPVRTNEGYAGFGADPVQFNPNIPPPPIIGLNSPMIGMNSNQASPRLSIQVDYSIPPPSLPSQNPPSSG